MTDSMKFGPEWLRNMSADSTNPNLLSSGSGGNLSANNSSNNNASTATTSTYNSGTGNQQHAFALFGNTGGSVSYTPAPRNTFPEFRYGREEMLSLFDKNCNMPDILPTFKKIFVEKVQYPLALTPSTDEEMLPQGPPATPQRPSWIQRSPVGFGSSTRGIGRGGSVDRGRMRGKSGYHQIYQRPTAMFEDDLRSVPSLKTDRGWPERNGAGDSLGISGSGSGGPAMGGTGIGLSSDWNGTPASSPRKEFSSHPRNMENWRRNRSEDGSGDASVGVGGIGNADGWRVGGGGGNSGVSSSFGSTHRWGRSTSWRDDDISPVNTVDGSYPTLTMQRSYSTITTVNERGGYMGSSGSGLSKSMQNSSSYAGATGNTSSQTSSRLSGLNSSTSRNHQWNSSSGSNIGAANVGDGDDNLPEWAMENPSDGGGTFDASGAFHGSVDEEETSTASNKEPSSGDNTKDKRKRSTSSSESSTQSGKENIEKDENLETPTNTTTTIVEKDKQADTGVRVSESSASEPAACESSTTDKEQSEEAPPNIENNNGDENNEPNKALTAKKVVNIPSTEGGQIQTQQKPANANKPSADRSSAVETPISTPNLVASPPVVVTGNTYYSNNSDSTSIDTKSSVRNTSENSGTGQRGYSDRMQEVADDMIEKLIMDDDSLAIGSDSNSGVEAKSSESTVTTTANNMRGTTPYVTPAMAAMMKQSTQHLQSAPSSVSPTLSAAITDSGTHKVIPLYGGGVVVDHATIQQHHHLQQVAVAANLAAAARLPHAAPPTDLWYYRDPQSKVQGPFSAIEMAEWYRAGYFNENLYVRRYCDRNFRALGELIKLCHDNMPFTHSHLLPAGLDNLPVPSVTAPRPQKSQILNDYNLKQQNDQREELKGNVTAAADFLSGAVKNLSPVDMSNVLSMHFQILQERYLRHQEMVIFNELSKNERFQRLTSSEKEAVVRQKLQHHGLPEYLTSLAGLNNSLATLNPTAGNQLYDAIAECSKKEHIFGGAPGSGSGSSGNAAQQHQQQGNPFLDADNFIINSQQQLPAQFPSAPYALSAVGNESSTGVSASKLNRGGDEISNNEMLNNYNLRMFLPNANTNSPQLPHPKPQDYINTPNNTSDFLTEQPLMSAANPMVTMWYPSIPATVSNATSQQTPLMSSQPTQQQQQAPSTGQPQSNQWSNNLMVGFPMPAMSGTQLNSAGVGIGHPLQPQHQPKVMPSSMWDLPTLEQGQNQHQQQQQQQQQLDINVISFDELNSTSALQHTPSKEQTIAVTPKQQQRKDTEHAAEPQMSIGNPIDDTVGPTSSTSSSSSLGLVSSTMKQQQRKDDTAEKYQQIKRNNKQQPTSNKGGSVKDDNANVRKNEEERRREQAEEKRRQKEEKKRQQLEEEKRRLQQIEEEKRRQMFEEKERQQQIQAQRRKAMLGNNNSSNTAASAVGTSNNSGANASTGSSKKEQRVQSSVAPWSIQTTAAATKSGPCLAEIQKAERRERRADQQRQMEMLEKQMRANAAAAEANDAMLKWNAPPIPVRSLAEIQAEEEKRLANEQIEIQRRKEQDQQQAAMAAGTLGGSNANLMTGGTNSISTIWSSTKVWGSAHTTGFWEEPIKFSTAVAGNTTNPTTAAVVVAGGLGGNNSGNNSNNNNKQAQIAQQKSQAGSVSTTSNASTSNTGQQQQGGNGARNLRKSQTVSVMQNTNANNGKNVKGNQQNNVGGAAKSGANNKAQHKADGGGSGSGNEKKNNAKNQHNNGANCTSNATPNKRDDYENEFTVWCTKSLNNMNAKVDVPTFVTFLQDLESPYEVKDYIRMYLGETKEYTEFAKQFLERRSKYKNLQRAQNAHNDDMCKPAPAITPSGNESSDNKSKQKKLKKNKMTKLDARILGFSVTAAEGRINVGARDYADAP